jgi:hypothetical protein
MASTRDGFWLLGKTEHWLDVWGMLEHVRGSDNPVIWAVAAAVFRSPDPRPLERRSEWRLLPRAWRQASPLRKPYNGALSGPLTLVDRRRDEAEPGNENGRYTNRETALMLVIATRNADIMRPLI